MRADLKKATVFDLSVGSANFDGEVDATGTTALTARLFERIRRAGASAGIGRYDEARLLYAGPAFEGPQGEHPERRTVHLGIDVFVEPGSEVLAPLDGRVHSARDNAERLDYGPTVLLEHAPPGGPRFHTLYGHLTPDSLEGLTEGRTIRRGILQCVGEKIG